MQCIGGEMQARSYCQEVINVLETVEHDLMEEEPLQHV